MEFLTFLVATTDILESLSDGSYSFVIEQSQRSSNTVSFPRLPSLMMDFALIYTSLIRLIMAPDSVAKGHGVVGLIVMGYRRVRWARCSLKPTHCEGSYLALDTKPSSRSLAKTFHF